MAQRTDKDDPEQDDGDEEDDEDGDPSSSPRAQVPPRSPPTATEILEFKRRFPAVVKEFTALVWFKINLYGDIEPPSQEHIHQDVFTRLWAKALRTGVPALLKDTISSITWRTLREYVRNRGRKARRAREAVAAPSGPAPGADPHPHVRLLIEELAAQLPPDDFDLIRWIDGEGQTPAEVAERLGIHERTLRSRLRTARSRAVAILDPPSKKDPKP